MEFGKFDTSAQAEAGRAFDILHQMTRKPLTEDGKTARMIIRAPFSKTVQTYAPPKLDDSVSPAEKNAWARKFWAPFIAGFENVERDGKPATAADADWFLALTPDIYSDKTGKKLNKTFIDQVSECAAALAAELGNAAGG